MRDAPSITGHQTRTARAASSTCKARWRRLGPIPTAAAPHLMMEVTMPQENEIRSLVRPIEVRADGDEQGSVAAGYAATFNSRTEIGDWFTEVIAPGAFAESLKTADVRALFDHDSAKVLGRSSAGTLRVSEDDIGLAVEIDLPDTSTGRDVRELLKRGDITGMSFGFRVQKQEWDDTIDPPL